ncbi:MAG TPA: GatB/YqeY domain-containing protein [Candidatus Polarisedimenticolia bacterium]|jgi:hypothetical protein
MSIKQRIMDDLTAAMKSGARERLGVLRMIKAKMQEAEVNLRGAKGRDYQLDDAESTQVLVSYAKQRRDSIDSFRKAGREDLATREESELAIVKEYMPVQMSEDEVRRIVREAIAQCGATSPKEMGAVMKLVMPKVKGAADGKMVNQIVNELLAAK